MARENRVELPLGLGYWTSRSDQNNRLSLKNWYPEQDPAGKAKIFLAPTSGTRLIYTHNTGTYVRSILRDITTTTNKRFFTVIGNELLYCTWNSPYSITVNNTKSLPSFTDSSSSTSVSIVPIDDDQVFIFENGIGYAYVYTISTDTLTQVTDADYPANAQTATSLDQYAIVTERNSGKFYLSALADPTNWNALDFATAEHIPDTIVRAITNKGYLWLFGTMSTEVWYNSGNVDFTFEPLSNIIIDFGLLDPSAITNADGDLYLISNSFSGKKQVIRFNGFDPTIISNPAVDELLNRIDHSTFQLDAYQRIGANVVVGNFFKRGHIFIYITVPPTLDTESVGFTIIFDPMSNQWHLRETTSGASILGESIVNMFGETYVGSTSENKIYNFDDTESTDLAVYSGSTWQSGTNIEKQIVTQYFEDKATNVQWHTIELEVEQPVATVDASTPTINLEWSNNGGITWSNAQSKTIATTGRNRLRWHRLGTGRDRVFRFTTSTPAPIYIHNCWADITKDIW